MKISDIRSMSPSQLNEEGAKIKKELFNLRFQRAAGESIKTSRVKELRKNFARIQTIMNQIDKINNNKE